jgi:hypothetical protein
MGIRIRGWRSGRRVCGGCWSDRWLLRRAFTNSVWVASKPGCSAGRLPARRWPSLAIVSQSRLLHENGQMCFITRKPLLDGAGIALQHRGDAAEEVAPHL